MKMSEETPTRNSFKWRHPAEVMQLQKLKKQKKALSARINTGTVGGTALVPASASTAAKRKNPFAKSNADDDANKRAKTAEDSCQLSASNDATLFKLLNISSTRSPEEPTRSTFSNILQPVQVKVTGEKWIPIDWSLKRKVRFLSRQPFAWSQALKISEEASGVTSFTRCLAPSSSSALDTSPNSKFHQCCLVWQQPSIPWLTLFPRSNTRSTHSTIPMTAAIKQSLHLAWMNSLRSLFHLIRTRQCPYFYACANSFTVLFRAAGIGGFAEMHALITPTTRGFRALLRREEIDFSMPLQQQQQQQVEELVEPDADKWMESMGLSAEDIKQINYTQTKVAHKADAQVDNSQRSLVLIQGVEVQAFYGFLVHCKSAVSPTGLFAGIPPTLLAPVAFHGATLTPLQVRETKVHVDDEDYFSLDLTGPILPHCIHNLCALHPKDVSMTATFSTLEDTIGLSKVANVATSPAAGAVFSQENLSGCGLVPQVLAHFCSNDARLVNHVECLKYTAESINYAWT